MGGGGGARGGGDLNTLSIGGDARKNGTGPRVGGGGGKFKIPTLIILVEMLSAWEK